MWVILRLLVATVVGVARFFWRWGAKGELRHHGDLEWQYVESKHKNRVVATAFGVTFRHPVRFRLSSEGRLDRLFKAVGFTHEVQTGDPAFDGRLYIACDHPALAPVLQEDAGARAAILELFTATTKAIRTDGEMLWVTRTGNHPPTDKELAQLARLREALQAVPAESLHVLRDGFFWRALLVESIAWSVALYGTPGLIEIATRRHPQYFEWEPVISTGLGAAVGVFVLLFGLSWWLLRGSSRAHRVLTESLILLLLGVPLSSIQAVSDVNIALDRSPAEMVEAGVESKHTRITRGRRGRRQTHYHLVLQPPAHAPTRVPRDIEVASAIYHRATPGGRLEIEFRSGALGIPWVGRVEPRRAQH